MVEIQVLGIKNGGCFWASPQGRENVNVFKCTRVEAELGQMKGENLYWPGTKLMENVIEGNEKLRL